MARNDCRLRCHIAMAELSKELQLRVMAMLQVKKS
jgi:hypothetical protein